MNLRVGPYIYRVHQVPGYLEHDGRQCLGLCDNERHEIFVSDVPNESQQVQIVCHEYMEAWMYHFGHDMIEHPAKEAMCDLFGMAMAQFAFDFMHAAGNSLPSFANMSPKPSPPAPPRAASPDITTKRRPPLQPKRYWHPPTSAEAKPWRVTVYEPCAT